MDPGPDRGRSLNQFNRHNLTPYQRAELALKLESIIAVKAKENQGTRTDLLPNSAKGESVHTDVELAKTAGVGKQIIQRTRYLTENADDDTKDKLRRGEVSVNQAYTPPGR